MFSEPAHRAFRYSAPRRWVPVIACGAVFVLVVVWFLLAMASSPPAPLLSLVRSPRRRTAGDAAVLSASFGAQEAVALSGVGTIATSGTQAPTPIASLTKVMTALVVLRDHPFPRYGQGPEITVTPAEVATYQQEQAAGYSVVPVSAGEQLTEFQALEGALIPSGDNIARVLALWDAGSTQAFVAKMNALARRLGLSHTHYAGPSGVKATTVSTATDQIRLAQVAMANPIFRSIVSLPQVTLPVAGVQYNVNADLGADGIDGIKTGWVPQGGGCFVFAAMTVVGGSTTSIIGVVLDDQGPSPLPDALAAAERIVVATEKDLTTVRFKTGAMVATLRAPYSASVDVVTTSPVSLVTWRGAPVHLRLRASRALSPAIRAGRVVGRLGIGSGGVERWVRLRAVHALSGPSFFWRLLHP